MRLLAILLLLTFKAGSQCLPDTIPPVISNCPGDIINCSSVTNYPPPTASDECNLANFFRVVNDETTFTSVVQHVYYIAVDGIGNTDSCYFTITYPERPSADAGGTFIFPWTQTPTIMIRDTADHLILGGDPVGSGGGPPYIYVWSSPFWTYIDTTANLVLPNDSIYWGEEFLLYVIDTNGCAATDHVLVEVDHFVQLKEQGPSQGFLVEDGVYDLFGRNIPVGARIPSSVMYIVVEDGVVSKRLNIER